MSLNLKHFHLVYYYLIAAILSICGMALFGTFTAFVARWFFGEQVLEAMEKKQK